MDHRIIEGQGAGDKTFGHDAYIISKTNRFVVFERSVRQALEDSFRIRNTFGLL